MTETEVGTKDPLLAFPGYLLRRASVAAVGDLNSRLARFELRHAEFALLSLVRSNAGLSQSEAGRALDIQRPNMATLVARLEKRGLIDRRPIDRRSKGLHLTNTGRTLVVKATAAVEDCERDLIERVPADLRPLVMPILTALWRGDSKDDSAEEAAGRRRQNTKVSNNSTQ